MSLRELSTGLLLIALAGLIGFPAFGQKVRTPELNVQYHRAEAAWKSGASVLEAKVRVDRVLEAIPNDAEALKLRAQVLIDMNRPADAVQDAERAVSVSPEDGEAYVILCEAARMSGQTILAEHAMDAALELPVEEASLLVRLSWNAMLMEKLDRAEGFARSAAASEPEEPAVQYQLARVLLLAKQEREAAAVLTRGLEAALLDSQTIVSDSILIRLASHPDVQPLLNE